MVRKLPLMKCSCCETEITSEWAHSGPWSALACPKCGMVEILHPDVPLIEPAKRRRLSTKARLSLFMGVLATCAITAWLLGFCDTAKPSPTTTLTADTQQTDGGKSRGKGKEGASVGAGAGAGIGSGDGPGTEGPTASTEGQTGDSDSESESKEPETDNSDPQSQEPDDDNADGDDNTEGDEPKAEPQTPSDPIPPTDELESDSPKPDPDQELRSSDNQPPDAEDKQPTAPRPPKTDDPDAPPSTSPSDGQTGATEGDTDVGDPTYAVGPAVLFSGLPAVCAMAIATDRMMMATGHQDGCVRLWGLPNNLRENRTIRRDSTVPHAIAFSNGGQYLAVLSRHRVELYGLPERDKLLEIKSPAELTALAFSGDDSHLATAERDGGVTVRKLSDLSAEHRLPGHGGVLAVAWCEDRNQFAVASADNVVRFWSPDGKPATVSLTGHWDWVSGIGVSESARMLVTSSWDRTLRAWDIDTMSELAVWRGHTSRAVAVAVSPDGQLAASGTDTGVVKVWDTFAGMELATFRDHTQTIAAIAFITDELVVSVSEDGSAKVFHALTGVGKAIPEVGGPKSAKDRGTEAQQKQYMVYADSIQKGHEYLERKEYEQASDYFKKATEMRPDYAEAHYLLGDCLCRLERREQALASYQRAIELQPNSGWYRYRLGAALYELKRSDDAIKVLIKACERLSDVASPRLLLAHCYAQGEQYGDAVREYKNVLEQLPQSHEAYCGLGRAHSHLQAWDLAIDELRQALEIQPEFGTAYSDLIDVLLAVNPQRTAEASQWADLARSLGIELRSETAERLKKATGNAS